MRIKCYDKYRKQHLIIEWTDDDLDWCMDTFASKYCMGKIPTTFLIDGEGEDPHPKRWSDLEQFEIIK